MSSEDRTGWPSPAFPCPSASADLFHPIVNLGGDFDTFLNSINLGNAINAIVLSDVPAGRQLDTVELHDSPFSTGTSVSVR